MYYFLTAQLKERMLQELRFFWSRHPRYASTDGTLDLVSHIQGKYAHDERPQRSIIVKNSGGSHVSLSPDNFAGHIESYVILARVPGHDGLSLEWVRENERLVGRQTGFPSPPGIYYVQITKSDETGGEFIVDPLLDSENDMVAMVSPTEGQLAAPFVPGTLRLYEMPGNIPLFNPEHFTSDPEEGTITLVSPLSSGTTLSADYRFAGERRGPFPFRPNHADVQAIPGAVLAFGRRYKTGDILSVIVQRERCLAARAYAGKWEINLDFDVTARDPQDQEEILDNSVMHLFTEARARLSSDGIEILNIALGGETEEIYNDEQDTYYYSASFSVTIQTDWEIHEPLALIIRRVMPVTEETARGIAGLSDEAVAQISSNIRLLRTNDLIGWDDPFFVGRSQTMEMIR